MRRYIILSPEDIQKLNNDESVSVYTHPVLDKPIEIRIITEKRYEEMLKEN